MDTNNNNKLKITTFVKAIAQHDDKKTINAFLLALSFGLFIMIMVYAISHVNNIKAQQVQEVPRLKLNSLRVSEDASKKIIEQEEARRGIASVSEADLNSDQNSLRKNDKGIKGVKGVNMYMQAKCYDRTGRAVGYTDANYEDCFGAR